MPSLLSAAIQRPSQKGFSLGSASLTLRGSRKYLYISSPPSGTRASPRGLFRHPFATLRGRHRLLSLGTLSFGHVCMPSLACCTALFLASPSMATLRNRRTLPERSRAHDEAARITCRYMLPASMPPASSTTSLPENPTAISSAAMFLVRSRHWLRCETFVTEGFFGALC